MSPLSDVDESTPGTFLVAPARQWLHATTGRIATCAHSWLTAVHWVNHLAANGLYTPTQAHGPKWGATTMAIAQEIARLKVCRPGIAYLMRKLKLKERTVQYHLTMLRETGLLVYRSKGTRRRGEANEASVYERTVPAAFDAEHGVRTVGEGVQRRPVGVAEHARQTVGKLAKKATQKIRKTSPKARSKSASSGQGRCTPMEGGTSSTSSTGLTYSPPESKLASGAAESHPGKKPNRRPRKLNKIGRRYQLARELIQLVPWLRSASVPRIAWIIRHVADAGWTALEVQAIAEQERPILAAEVRRPSGLLADRLGTLHTLYNTPERRRTAVLAWQESRIQEQARHAESAQHADHVQGPTSQSAQNLMREAIRRNDELVHGPVVDADCHTIDVETGEGTVTLEDFDRELIKTIRSEAADDLSSITRAIDLGMTEKDARRLYTNWLVDQALAAQRRAELTPAF